MEGRFNSVCPYHVGKCKCSFKRIGRAIHSEGLSKGDDRDRSSKTTSAQAVLQVASQEVFVYYSQPNNAVDTRISRLIKCIEKLGMDSTPIVYLPSRLGESEMLDKAAEALIHLSMGPGYGSNTSRSTTSARSKYAQSVGLVRKELSTWNGNSALDALIGTISLLGVIDVLSKDDMRSKSQTALEFFTHRNGISNVLP